MGDLTDHRTVDEIIAILHSEAGSLDFDEQVSRLLIAALRELCQGDPLTTDRLARIAGELDIPQEKIRDLDWLAEKDDEGRLTGLAGLSLNGWSPHNFKVNGSELTTWCALDTLYLPPILRKTAEVETQDPATRERIRLTIDHDGVQSYTPTSTRLSIVVPEVKVKGLQSAEQVWTVFCNYSHFFASEETGRTWFTEKEMAPIFLSVDEGFDLGSKWFANLGKYA